MNLDTDTRVLTLTPADAHRARLVLVAQNLSPVEGYLLYEATLVVEGHAPAMYVDTANFVSVDEVRAAMSTPPVLRLAKGRRAFGR